MYSNSTLGATGRNIKAEDIEAVSSASSTGSTLDNSNGGMGGNLTVPKIFSSERSGTKKSDQTAYTTGTTSINIDSTVLAYSYTMSTSHMKEIYLELFRYQAGTTTDLSSGYWLASRGRNGSSFAMIVGELDFGIYKVSSGTISIENVLFGNAN